jgi:STAM-binding protein
MTRTSPFDTGSEQQMFCSNKYICLSNVIYYILTVYQARSYDRDGSEQDAYLFYMRRLLLLMDKVEKHPEVKLPGNKAVLRKAQYLAFAEIAARMEELKPGIIRRHDEYLKMVAQRKSQNEEWAKAHPHKSSLEGEMDRMSIASHGSVSTRTSAKKELHGGNGGNRALALSLARKEQRKRQTDQRSHTGADGQDESLQYENEGPSKLSDDEDQKADDLARRIVDAGKRGDDTFVERNGTYSPDGKTFTPRNWNYPTVPHKNAYNLEGAKTPSVYTPPNEPIRRESQGSQSTIRSMAPGRPPKEHFGLQEPPSRPPKEKDWSEPLQPQPPPLPGKFAASNISEPISRDSTATPEIDSQNYTFVPMAKTESGNPLRTVFISPNLRHQFLDIAQSNTSRNLETCGILCGTLISNAFFISKLVIPEQVSTSDTCDTVNEEALFDYCDSQDLMTLGWIHTHPTQTCFMSSRDLHTHGGYQVQMAESIAIVCAPTQQPA